MLSRLRGQLLFTTALWALGVASAAAGPEGATVVGGAATVSGAGTGNVVVNQTSGSAIINWNTFNIGAGQTTTFQQPGSTAVILNRVTGGLGPSTIDGTLTANGRVFLVNRDGVLFGAGAVINTASFLATTNDIRNADFMAGRMNFTIPGRPDASIVNRGTITAATGGFAALVAPGVRNSGTITATLGTVTLASGNAFTLDFYGDKLITLAVGDQIAAKVIDVATGRPMKSLVSNGRNGTLSANGGRVELTAAAARQVVNSVINNRGVIEANSVGMRNGKIVLGGATGSSKGDGAPRQVVRVSGKISVAGKNAGESGGTVVVTGENIKVRNAKIDASGTAGGGKVLIGGDWGGGNPNLALVNNPSARLEDYTIANATTVSVDKLTTIDASATGSGNGGKVVLWSDSQTTFAGTILARGGAQAGDGGFVETSSHGMLNYAGMVDTRAPQGATGTLLLDPDDFTIDAAAANTIVTNLGSSNVTIQTTASGTGGSGDITVASNISWTGDNSLTLSAYRNIAVNADITNTLGRAGVTLHADNTGTGTGTVTFGAGKTVTTDGDISILYNPPGNNNATVNAFSYTVTTDYSGNMVGAGTQAAFMLVNTVYDLQNVQNNRSGTFALGKSIDAGVTAGWNSGAGFSPIGTSAGAFTGSFDGQGQVIDGLRINSSLLDVGLFGAIGTGGRVGNLGLMNVLINSNNPAGGAGGLAGANFGTIDKAYVTGSLTTNADGAGLLVGFNGDRLAGPGVRPGFINRSYSSGSVSSNSPSVGSAIGGLVGFNLLNSSITNSYSTASVTASGNVNASGGLVGQNNFQITTSYSSGAVSGGTNHGGLLGILNFNTTTPVQDSFWDKETSGQPTSAGGIAGGTGLLTTQARTQSCFASTSCGGAGTWNFSSPNGTWFMVEGMTRPFLRSEASATIVNAHQLQLMLLNPATAYTIARNIDLGPDLAAVGGKYPGMWGAAGFVPIGNLPTGFTGVIEGANHTISNLAINSNAQLIGLFGYIGSGGAVRNLVFANSQVAATSTTGRTTIGLLAGQNDGSIQNVSTAGNSNSVTATLHTATTAGGLVGLNVGTISGNLNGGTEVKVAVTIGTGEFNGNFNYAGGLAGINTGTITDMRASGNVTAANFNFAGGLVGQNGNTGNPGGNLALIQNSSASGTVTSGYTAGGLAGVNFVNSNGTTRATIRNSHATGNVVLTAGGFTAGGLVGQNQDRIENSFYDTGVVQAAGSSNFALDAGVGGLVGNNQSSAPGIVATIFDSHASATVNVGQNVNAGGLVGFNDAAISDSFATGAVNATNGPPPGNAGGLVGYNSSAGTISDSYATGAVTLSGNNASDATGGGLVGQNEGSIANSFATGNVTATGGATTIGGFVGVSNFGGVITDSYATGNVTLTGATVGFAGGFAGGNAGSIDPSFATGNVSVDGMLAVAGGFLGFNFGSIDHVFATGNVSVSGTVGVAGGLVGLNAGPFSPQSSIGIDQAFSIGTVSGSAAVNFLGGLIGLNFGKITHAYSISSVSGGPNSYIGGLVGLNLGSLDQTFAAGALTGGAGSTLGGLVAVNLQSFLGGIAFESQIAQILSLAGGSAVTNSYWDTDTTGQAGSAGGTGLTTIQLIAGLPPGFDPSVWTILPDPSYPYFIWQSDNLIPNVAEPPVTTTPNRPPSTVASTTVSQNANTQFQFVKELTRDLVLVASGEVVNIQPLFTLTQQQGQVGTQGGQGQQQTGPGATRFPGQLDVGLGRLFVIPPLNETRLVTNEVLMQFPSNITRAEVEAIAARLGLTILDSQNLGLIGVTGYRFALGSGALLGDVIRAAADIGVILGATGNYKFVTTQAPEPASTGGAGDAAQYVPGKFRLPEVHRTFKGANVPIAVIDSQIDGAHPDLAGAITESYNAAGGDDQPHMHGTGMAGAIAAHQRVLGVAPSARLFAVKAFSASGSSAESTTYSILKGIDWAVGKGVRIINMSFAGPRDPSLERAIKAAYDKGVVLIGAAGNAGPNSPPLYPGADPNVIAVTATDMNDKLFNGANRGRYIAIAAPGVEVYVPAPDGIYQVTTGTSVATAEVSGIVALLLERNPSLRPADVRRILTQSAKRLGPNNEFGAGLVDPVKALQLADPRISGR